MGDNLRAIGIWVYSRQRLMMVSCKTAPGLCSTASQQMCHSDVPFSSKKGLIGCGEASCCATLLSRVFWCVSLGLSCGLRSIHPQQSTGPCLPLSHDAGWVDGGEQHLLSFSENRRHKKKGRSANPHRVKKKTPHSLLLPVVRPWTTTHLPPLTPRVQMKAP